LSPRDYKSKNVENVENLKPYISDFDKIAALTTSNPKVNRNHNQ
jgi:hypothetical protein